MVIFSKGNEVSIGFTRMDSQQLAPIGTPTLNSDFTTDFRSHTKSLQAAAVPVVAGGEKDSGQVLIYENKIKVLDAVPTPLGSWDNTRMSQQINMSEKKCVKAGFYPKTKVFLSPKMVLGPGSVANKWFYDIDFPGGHIALKNFNVEVVDKAGNSVPLHETYLHHWVSVRYFERIGIDVSKHIQSSG